MKKKRSAAAIGRQSRQKGRKAEADVARQLREAGFASARRSAQRRGAPDSPDVLVDELPHLAIEVKWDNAMTPWRMIAQAVEQMGPDQVPVGWMKKDSTLGPGHPTDRDWLVVMRPKDWLEMLALAEWAKAYGGARTRFARRAILARLAEELGVNVNPC